MKLLNDNDQPAKHLFLTTGEREKFKHIAEEWLKLQNLEVQSIQL